MEVPDELGVLADYCRVSIVQSLLNILWEIISNRRHNEDKSTAKFLFCTCGPYFILGTNHYRTRESVEKEHTPFKFNESKREADASISSRGYGAKMFPFHVQGKYCNLFRMNDGPFTTELKEWGMKEWIDLDHLRRIIDKNEPFEKDLFRSRIYDPITKKPGRVPEVPFFCEDEFRESPLATFINEHNFKYFYVFVDFNKEVLKNLLPTLSDLDKIFEGQDIEIYNSSGYQAPKRIQSSASFGLLPKYWTGALVFDWRIGEKKINDNESGVRHFYKSEFKLTLPNSNKVFYGKNDSNGSSNTKFALRCASFEPSMSWRPQVRITVALTSPSYRQTIEEFEKLQEHIYLRIEDETVSYREADPRIASKLRHLKEPSRIRLIVDILNESVKTNPEAGLTISSVKSMSHISSGKAIFEMIEQSLALAKKHMDKVTHLGDASAFVEPERMKEMEGYINKNLAAASRSQKRKKEGLKFESGVGEYLRENISCLCVDGEDMDINWELNDSTIAANHDLDGQAIDALGEVRFSDYSIWLADQCKDRESAIPQKEITSFIKSVNSLRKQKQSANPKDKVIAVLTLAKPKAFNYELYFSLLQHGILTVVESTTNGGKIGEATEKAFWSQIEQLV